MEILQARILEWVAISSSRDLANPGVEPRSPIAGLSVYLHNNYFFVDNWGKWAQEDEMTHLKNQCHRDPLVFTWNYHNIVNWLCMCAELLQFCPTLCDLMDYSPPGSSVHGIFQARILEWVAISSSRGSSWPKDWTCVSYISCTGRQVVYH